MDDDSDSEQSQNSTYSGSPYNYHMPNEYRHTINTINNNSEDDDSSKDELIDEEDTLCFCGNKGIYERCFDCDKVHCADHGGIEGVRCVICNHYCCGWCENHSYIVCCHVYVCFYCVDYIHQTKNKKFVIEYVKENGHCLKYIADDFKHDIDVIVEAIKNTICAFKHTSTQHYKTIYILFLTLHITWQDGKTEMDSKDNDTLSCIQPRFNLDRYIEYCKINTEERIKKIMLPYLQCRVGQDTIFIGFIGFDIEFHYDYNTNKRKINYYQNYSIDIF